MHQSERALPTVSALYRYPIKGLNGEALTSVRLTAGETFPFDRAFAIENGPGPFDSTQPKHLPKIHFLVLMRNEGLASLDARFDDSAGTLTLAARDGPASVTGELATAAGRAAIEAFIAERLDGTLRGVPRIVSAAGHNFTDVSDKCVHIVNLESVRALESKIGATVDVRRFRPNIVIDRMPAWAEFDLVGKSIQICDTAFEVFERTERCAATNVNPDTAVRDLKIPSFLSRTYGHTDFGVYARVATSGTVSAGDPLR